MSKKLELIFSMNNGTKKTYTINDPKSNLTLAENIDSVAAMFTRSENNPVQVGGIRPVQFIGAAYEEVIRTEIMV